MFLKTIRLKIITIAAIIPYSLKNKRTKRELPISTLKPLMSSLSPSKRSKGARFLSTKDIRSHRKIHISRISIFKKILLAIEKAFKIVKEKIKIIMRDTSNESL